MLVATRLGLSVFLFAVLAVGLRAQGLPEERPSTAPPLKAPTREELNRREAIKLYAVAALHERGGRLIQAIRTYEEAAHLDPEAAPAFRSLAPLYLAVDRLDDALAACRKVLDLDPGDFRTWYLYARQLKALHRPKEAVTALTRALACPALKDKPEECVTLSFELGALYEKLQENDKAETAYLEVLRALQNPALVEDGEFTREEVDTRAAETLERLGHVSLHAGKNAAARDYFIRARDRVKGDADRAHRLSYNLAEVHLARGEGREALERLNEYLEEPPTGTDAYRAKVKALELLGRTRDIVPELQAHVRNDPKNLGLKLLIAERIAAAGDTAKAVESYREIGRTFPDPDVYRGLFKLFAAARPAKHDAILASLDDAVKNTEGQEKAADAEAAEATVRAMLTALRGDAALVRGLLSATRERLLGANKLHTLTTYYLGALAIRTRQAGDAETLFRSCLGAGRLTPEIDYEVHRGLLQVLRAAHKNEAIIEICRQGSERSRAMHPSAFHSEAALALLNLGKKDEARREINAAVDESKDDEHRSLTYRCMRARILAQLSRKDYAQGVAECKELLGKYKGAEEVRNIRHTLSTVYAYSFDYAKSEEQLKLILEADPNDATACNDLGYHWAVQGKNLEEAERLVRKALELDRQQRRTQDEEIESENAAYLDSLAWVLFRRGQFDAARKELEKAVVLPEGADSPEIWDHLADIYARQGETARARVAYQKSVDLYEVVRARPKDDHYTETLQKLKQLR
jgi:tetratricopeptide (TPR) repeat protein